MVYHKISVKLGHMFQFDNNFLLSLGLGTMPDDQKESFLEVIREELEYRVGMRLSEGVPRETLEQFENLIDAEDSTGAMTWLDTHKPDYKQVVMEELDKLREEIVASKDKILS